MRRFGIVLGQAAFMGFFCAGALAAQDLEEVCPGAEDGTGALWGIVSDTDAEMALPGATVVATWETDGKPGRAEAQSGLDGGFKLCYVPLKVDVAVQPTFATVAGPAVTVTLTDTITRQDLGFSLTGTSAVAADDDRILACLGGAQSQINLQNSRLFRCDAHWPALSKCPKEEMGTVMANASGSGGGVLREMLESIAAETRRLGANALINFNIEESRGSVNSDNSDAPIGAIRATAVKIDVDPTTC